MIPFAPLALEDAVVRLAPLSVDHVDGLVAAASIARDAYRLTRVPSGPDATRAYVDLALDEAARGVSLPFATIDAATGRVVGSTRYMNVERWTWPAGSEAYQRGVGYTDALEIGATWLAADAQRTGINTHAKLLMLTFAFESLEVHRVAIRTDARNLRSRTAIARIGATFEGVLRSAAPAYDGTGPRDTATFSIVRAEWPAVKARLLTLAR